MTRTRIIALVFACLALAVVAAGCGGANNSSSSSDSGSTGAAASPSASTDTTSSGSSSSSGSGAVTIKMQNIAFAPKSVTVKVGQTIKWENDDTVDHNVTATAGEQFKSKDFGKGGTYSYKVDKAGTIKYACTLHPGMEGTITVTK